MVFTKSFGYALRGILYVAVAGERKGRIQLDEISEVLALPRFFLGKIMRRLAKEGILDSDKGHNGGFSINERTLTTTLSELVNLTGNAESMNVCALRLKKCNTDNPCPVHHEIKFMREQWKELLAEKTVGDLLKKGGADFIESIATNQFLRNEL